MIREWARDGVKPFIYINPYFANVTGEAFVRQNQFEEGFEKGYFIKNKDGSTYLM
jgi:alpha-glucosidase (family GH31 glycosyl hydrolase)